MKQVGQPLIGPSGAALPLSAGIEAGGFVFVSGQLSLKDGKLVDGDVAAQTNFAIDAIAGVLAEAGLDLEHVVRCGVWLTRAEDFPGFNAAYAARFATPFPARATVISTLAVPGALVEIDAIAWRPA